ncbi:MAG: enoyl-CoA hydratase/isomerase family protein, partial [Proteobacteria bacterium]|nr:enoyl-CoA hydratase/isomerase family protein [Pseudomonadota bacterium]
MTDYETVKYAQDNAVAVITIDRPDAMNSFNEELRRDLLAACDRAAGDSTVR